MLDGPRVSWVQGMADPERPRPRVRWVEPGAPPFRQSFVFFKSAPSEEVLLFLVRQRCSIAWLHEAVETLPDVAYTKYHQRRHREEEDIQIACERTAIKSLYGVNACRRGHAHPRTEEHTSELQSLMHIQNAVSGLQK